MAVRVRVRIRHTDREEVSSALVNTGFETERPEILLPIRLAQQLGLHPPPSGSAIHEYETVAGPTLLIEVGSPAEVQVLAGDRDSGVIRAQPLISDVEREILLSDRLASELGIAIEEPGRGLWRFRGEDRTRESVAPRYWR